MDSASSLQPMPDPYVAAAEARVERAYRAWLEARALAEEALKEYHAAFDAVMRTKLPDGRADA